MEQQHIEVDETPTTTTPILAAWQNLPNPCKFRGHTIEILEALYDCGNLTTRELSNITGLEIEDIKGYCRNGRKNCIITRIDRWKWMITDYGCFVYEINKNNIVKGVTNGKQKGNERVTKGYRTFNSEKKQHQLNLSIFEKNEDLTELQRVVVVAMAEHYKKTRRPFYKFMRYDDFRDQLGLDTKYSWEDIQEVAISLEVAGIVYIYERGDIKKVGLLKETIEKMQHC